MTLRTPAFSMYKSLLQPTRAKLWQFLIDVAYAQIVDGVLQITPDLEEDIAAAERADTISLDEFKTQFARWIEK